MTDDADIVDAEVDIKKQLLTAIAQISTDRLPLHKATTQGGIIKPGSIDFGLLDYQTDKQLIRARFSVFFTEIVGGCNCHDDPAEHPVYCAIEADFDDRLMYRDMKLLLD